MSRISAELKTLIDSIDDVEIINKLANLNSLVEQDERDQQAFMDKYVALQRDYKDAILHSAFKDEPKDELAEPKQVNFIDVVSEIIKNS